MEELLPEALSSDWALDKFTKLPDEFPPPAVSDVDSLSLFQDVTGMCGAGRQLRNV